MDGYNKLACLMASQPELCIMRRFGALNVRNLLFIQAELVLLEDDLKDTVKKAAASSCDDLIKQQYAFQAMLDSADGRSEHRAQLRLSLKIKQKLKEFNEALLQVTSLGRLPSADKADVEGLRTYLDEATQENKQFLSNRERWTWSSDNDGDFVSLANSHREEDAVTTWICRRLIPLYHRLIGHKTKDDISLAEKGVGKGAQPCSDSAAEKNTAKGVQHYSDSAAVHVVEVLSTVFSSLLPTVAIFVLYFIKPTIARISAIMVFTMLFSITVSIITRARRVDCFTATAAFVAVLVVFVGNPGPNCSSGNSVARS